jgi:hypothetical protein
MTTRTSYHYVLCWEKNGEVFSDPPACKDYTERAEAIADAEIASRNLKPNQWFTVWQVEEFWDAAEHAWVAEDPLDWTPIHETESGGAKTYTLSWNRVVRGLHSTEEQGDSIDGEFHSFEDAKEAADQYFREENGSGNRDTIGVSWAVLDESGVVYETEVVK